MNDKHEKKVAEIRSRIDRIRTDLENLRAGVRPLERAKELLIRHIEAAAGLIEPAPQNVAGHRGEPYYYAGHSQDPARAGFAFACRFNRAAVENSLMAELEEFYADAPTIKDPDKIEKLQTELRALLSEEEALVVEAKRRGDPIARRADADVGVILGL